MTIQRWTTRDNFGNVGFVIACCKEHATELAEMQDHYVVRAECGADPGELCDACEVRGESLYRAV
jgi:hypothetical protein